jgi:hypothetical protein
MPDQMWAGIPPDATGGWLSQHNFARCVMSDVYALLDYLSGRALPSLTAPSHHSVRSHRHSIGVDALMNEPMPAEMTREMIEHDLADQVALLSRAMMIGKQLDADNGGISAAELAFLIRARDQLNVWSAPATGNSISFTIRVVGNLLGKEKDKGHGRHNRYIIPDESLDAAAFDLAVFVRGCLRLLKIVLILTVLLSTYVACGKLLLDTRDAANRDSGANFTSLSAVITYNSGRAAASNAASDTPNLPARDTLINNICQNVGLSALVEQNCSAREELRLRKKDISDLLRMWVCPFCQIGSDEKVAQWSSTLIGIIGNYLLPVLYGWLGALGFVLRRLNRQLADCLLTPRDIRANSIRIVLGTVTGACIGLFVNSSTGAATLTGVGGAAVTLSASGVAFLAGYGVEGVFKMLDTLINKVFTNSDGQKDRSSL